jgi:hypothetical protein
MGVRREIDEKNGLSFPNLLKAVGANSKTGCDFLSLAARKKKSPHWATYLSPLDLDRFGLVCTVANTDAREVKALGVDAHERGRALIMDYPRALPASSSLVRLERPSPQSLRRWSPGCKCHRNGARPRRGYSARPC